MLGHAEPRVGILALAMFLQLYTRKHSLTSTAWVCLAAWPALIPTRALGVAGSMPSPIV